MEEGRGSQDFGGSADKDLVDHDGRARMLPADDIQSSTLHVLHTHENIPQFPCRCGYRDKRTGICYLNAFQQTDGRKTGSQGNTKCTRETQLCKQRNQCWNTTRETWTQMDRKGVLLDSSQDYELYTCCYEDSKQWEGKRNKAATTIQQYARRRSARLKLHILEKHARERCQLFAEQERSKKMEENMHLEQEIHKHRHPRAKKDFGVLQEELEAWRLEELNAIMKKGLQSEERKTALQELLQKEIKFLQAIGKMKLAVAEENREEKIKQMFWKMSSDKTWELSNGSLVHVQTPSTLRAADLMRLYTALAKISQTVDERMCVLGYIKWTVQEFECSLTKELVQLIEREADLMYRNRPAQSLSGLRQRILELFLKFVQVPRFNAEAARHQCVPVDFDHVSCQSLRRQNVPLYSAS